MMCSPSQSNQTGLFCGSTSRPIVATWASAGRSSRSAWLVGIVSVSDIVQTSPLHRHSTRTGHAVTDVMVTEWKQVRFGKFGRGVEEIRAAGRHSEYVSEESVFVAPS